MHVNKHMYIHSLMYRLCVNVYTYIHGTPRKGTISCVPCACTSKHMHTMLDNMPPPIHTHACNSVNMHIDACTYTISLAWTHMWQMNKENTQIMWKKVNRSIYTHAFTCSMDVGRLSLHDSWVPTTTLINFRIGRWRGNCIQGAPPATEDLLSRICMIYVW